MTHYVKDGGVWKPASNGFVKDAGVWKPIGQAHVKDAGVWKPFGYISIKDLQTVASFTYNLFGASPTLVTTTSTPASADRYILFLMSSGITVTVNGTAVSMSGGVGVAPLPTGSSISITFSGPNGGTLTGGAWTFTKSGAAPVLGAITAPSGASPLTTSVTRPARGFTVGYGLAGGPGPASLSGAVNTLSGTGGGTFNVVVGRSDIDTTSAATTESWTLTIPSSSPTLVLLPVT